MAVNKSLEDLSVMITIKINGDPVEADPDDTILDVARREEIYIPTLCYHPDLPPRKGGMPVDAVYQGQVKIENCLDKTPEEGLASGCGLCVVERVDSGELVHSMRAVQELSVH